MELSRGLAIQWAIVGTMGFGVAWALLGALYESVTGQRTTSELSMDVGLGVPVLGALLGLAYSFARSYLRPRRAAEDVASDAVDRG